MNADLPAGLRAVFAFLDEALPAEDREAFARTEVNRDHLHDMCWEKSTDFARDACRLIKNSFQLMPCTGPLGELLEEHRLYHESDIAPALTWAYSLHKRGKNPLVALTADYSFRWRAVLCWMTPKQIQQAINWHRFGDRQPWPMRDDRWVRYQTTGRMGTVVLRGDRLLCSKCEIKFQPTEEGFRHWHETLEKFDSLGGVEGFLAGKFEWPRFFITREEEVEHGNETPEA